MSYFLLKFKVIITVILLSLFSFPVFAQTGDKICSSNGYTVATVNGVLTDEDEAIFNRDSLELLLPIAYHGEKLTIEYLFNPIHSGGFGDLMNSVAQKAFENEVVADYDLIEMLKDASQKVKTQKLLLVAHSQGNFYANSFYDVVTTQAGGVPAQSIGVYSVATPASRVAGNGKWLTSDTDKVIAGVVGNLPFRKIKAPNTHIELQSGDDFSGHGFSEIYLKYRSNEIVKDITFSLGGLSENSMQDTGAPCISPPEISLAHKQQGLVYAITDPVLNPLGAGTLWTLGKGVSASIYVANTSIAIAVGTYHIAVNTAIWTYNTAVATGKAVGSGVVSVSSSVYNAIVSAFSSGSFASNNSAGPIFAVESQLQNTQTQPAVSVVDKITPATVTLKLSNAQPSVEAPQSPQANQTALVFEPKVQEGTNAPKLVFVGSFSTGGGSPTQQTQQILGTQTTAPVEEVVVVVDETVANEGAALAAPSLSAPQCLQTLAVDGCLLATTTVRFEWPEVADADHYLVNKNGSYATTTETAHDIELKDFSNYIMEVVAIGADGQASATSTQAVSVATIPIAINEIAWMGTVASANDEWFEIKNNTNHTIDLTQWELNAKDGAPHVVLTGTIAPRTYIIFERKDDTVVADIEAHATTTGALNNGGDQLTLMRNSVIFDQTPEGSWAEGFNSTSSRKTMERYSSREPGTDPENWGTNLGYIKNGIDAEGNAIDGTPGEQNSVSTLINKGEDITSDFTLNADEERYVVPEDDVLVSASAALTVAPGVEINFYNNGRLLINGILDTQGTPENPVIFRSFDDSASGAIVFWNTTGTSTIDYARIESTRGLIARGASTTVEISNTEFSGNATAIELYNGAHASLASSTIKDTFEYDAIGVYYSTMTIVSSTISNTIEGDAIGAYYSNVTIASSTISDTLDGDAIGVYYSTMNIASTTIDGTPDRNGIFSYKSVLDIENSTIRNTEDDAIILSNSTSTIKNSTIEGGTINEWGSGVSIYKGTAIIASTTISDITGWAGISVDEATLSISSSTIKNVEGYGLYAYNATSTISNVVVENGGISGVEINQGTATITNTSVSGFTEGAGVSVSLNREGNWQKMEAVPGVVASISNSEITGNAIGVEMEVGSAIIAPDVFVQENTKNIVVCSLVGECLEQ